MGTGRRGGGGGRDRQTASQRKGKRQSDRDRAVEKEEERSGRKGGEGKKKEHTHTHKKKARQPRKGNLQVVCSRFGLVFAPLPHKDLFISQGFIRLPVSPAFTDCCSISFCDLLLTEGLSRETTTCC